MKIHLISWHAMCFCFCIRQNRKNIRRCFFRTFRQAAALNNLQNIHKTSVLMYILCIMVMHIMPMHMLRSMIMCISMTMQIFHIMIMIFMFLIKNHIKVARIQTGFFYPGNADIKSLYRKACKSFFQNLLICSKIQKCCHRHISADTAFTLQI